MKLLVWDEDGPTKHWARQIHLITIGKQAQYDGTNFDAHEHTWRRRILVDGFPQFCHIPGRQGHMCPSPANIIRCWHEGYELEALALTVGWGNMARTNNTIYEHDLRTIRGHLKSARTAIVDTGSIKNAWTTLAHGLDWSPVITSKCLHFLARSLGYEENPPVPIDHAFVGDKLGPAFDTRMQELGGDPQTLTVWFGTRDSWDGYNCYMTAILSWSRANKWTTTETENTLFRQPFG